MPKNVHFTNGFWARFFSKLLEASGEDVSIGSVSWGGCRYVVQEVQVGR